MKVKRGVRITVLLIIVLAVMICGGFTYLYFNGMSGISNTTEAKEGQVRIACVGDSTTYGHGVSNWPGNNYPKVLQKLLGENYHVNNYGVSSYAVQDTSDRPYTSLKNYQQSLAYNADLVVFMMGSNDTKPENWISRDAFREDLLAILDSYSDSEIYLCTLPAAFFPEGKTQGVTGHDIQPLVAEEIAQVTREIAVECGYTLIDIHALTEQHPEWFAKDGVHPNNAGAAAIAQAVYEAIVNKGE